MQSDVRFSKDVLIAGDTVRLYATVRNVGEEDISGYVSFYQGTLLIGTSQVISLRAGGSPDEVYVDFVVPTGAFNIQAQIEGTEPADIFTENNSTITQMIEPVLDDDRDGVPNKSDNCVNVANNDQLDTDGDAMGDACDKDDDNDGLSDEVEIEIGTSTINKDTDFDGHNDQDDVYPHDPGRAVEEPEEIFNDNMPVAPSPEPQNETQVSLRQIISEVAKTIQNKKSGPGNTAEITEENLPETENFIDSDFEYSPNAVFGYKRISWSAFRFGLVGEAEESAVYTWDFGDGAKSSKSEVEHTFTSPGSYEVKLVCGLKDGTQIVESTTVLVPFFTLHNPVIATAVAVLVILLIASIVVIFATVKKQRIQKI
jgi:hypothetical protein